MRRTIVVENNKLKKELQHKEILTAEKNEIIKEYEVARKANVKKLNKIKEKLNVQAEKIKKTASTVTVDLREFEEFENVEVKKDKVVLTLLDRKKEFEVTYKEFKAKTAYDKRETKASTPDDSTDKGVGSAKGDNGRGEAKK